MLVNELNSIAALVLVHGVDFLSIFESLSRMLWLCCSSTCIIMDLSSPRYFGVCGSFHSLCLSVQVAIPARFLGVWLGLAGFAWVILDLTGVLLPGYQNKVDTYSQPAFLQRNSFGAVGS